MQTNLVEKKQHPAHNYQQEQMILVCYIHDKGNS